MHKVLLADDHPLVRDAMVRLLQYMALHGSAIRVETVSDAPALWQACQASRFDLVLLDLHMPGMQEAGGVKAYMQVFAHSQRTALFSGNITALVQQQFMQAGGVGVLSKSMNAPSMTAALQLLLAGETFVASLAGAPAIPKAHSALTPRQLEIYALVQQGMSNKAIAHALGLSVGTVKNHIGDIYQTLGVQSRYQVLGGVNRDQ